MNLLIVRHAPAGDAKEKRAWARSGKPASERPLSALGREKMKEAAMGLAGAVGQLDLIATSPYARAFETAVIVRKRLRAPLEETETLAPGAKPAAFAAWLKKRAERSIAAVGHEPHLGTLIAWLCTGSSIAFAKLKKGQACLLEVREPVPGGARLVWSLAPAQLRALARR